MNDEAKCKHGQLARSCEVCVLQEELDGMRKVHDEMLEDFRNEMDVVHDDYAQAALTGLFGVRDNYGRSPFTEWGYAQIVDEAFEIADLAMERREKR